MRPARAGASILAASAMLLTACTGSTGARHSDSVSDVIASLGAVPIPSAGPAEPTPTAHVGHPAVLAIGGPVRVTLPDRATALVTAFGPRQLSTSITAQRTRAIITLRVAQTRGSTRISSTDLSSRDETGHLLNLTPKGPSHRTVRAGKSADLEVAGTFTSGAAQVTYRHHGKVIAIWTFNIELD